jgi:segregation and condensation protein A
MNEVLRPTLPFQLSLPVFEGPVDDLLRLVSQRKISTCDVIVSDFTAQYRDYLNGAVDSDLDATGEFVSASARILAIKSADLLVLEHEEEEVEGSEPVHRTANELLRAVARILALREAEESFAPLEPPFQPDKLVEPRSPTLLTRGWHAIEQRSRSRVKRISIPAFLRLEAALSGLIRRVRGRGLVSFRSIVSGASRNDAVVYFIAVLELVRRRQVQVKQDSLMADITVEWDEGGSRASKRAG